MRRTTATTRAARVSSGWNPLAARGKNLIPPAARNFVSCGECRVWMAYSWRKAIHHNSKTLPQKKATEKWYRAVPFKNLTERSEGIPLSDWQRNTRVLQHSDECVRRGARKNKTLPTRPGAFLAKFKPRRKTAFVTAWKRAAETLLERGLAQPASLVQMFRP